MTRVRQKSYHVSMEKQAMEKQDIDSSHIEGGDNLAFPPLHTFVFVVGINDEWQQDRDTVGDVALVETFRNFCGVPEQHVMFLRDDNVSVSEVKQKLKQFLETTTIGSTFLFYYGGHGLAHSFCVPPATDVLSHDDIVSMIHLYFQGDFVWCMIDTCYSGNFYLAVNKLIPARFGTHPSTPIRTKVGESNNHEKSNQTFICVMSTERNKKAGGDWTLTGCLIRALKGTIPNTATSAELFTVREFLSYASDETARVKGDIMTVSIHTNTLETSEIYRIHHMKMTTSSYPCVNQDRNNQSLVYNLLDATEISTVSPRKGHLNKKCNPIFHKSKNSVSQVLGLGQNSLWKAVTRRPSSWKGINRRPSSWKGILFLDCDMGKKVYAKWPLFTSATAGDHRVLPPTWYPCEILSNNSTMKNTVEVHLHDPITEQSINMTVLCRDLLSTGHLCSERDMDSLLQNFKNAQLHYARHSKYISYSIKAGTNITAVYWHKKHYAPYKARILCWEDVSWEKVTDVKCRDEYKGEHGPFVPVEWEIDESWSIIPLSHIVRPVQLDALPR